MHLFVLLAIATAGISPACAFASGQKGWIEICAADGTIKRVQVSGDFLPQAGEQNEVSHHSPGVMDDCAFCFMTAQGKILKDDRVIFLAVISGNYLKVTGSTYIPGDQKAISFSARGPPSIS